jgi:hypothetical protein
MGVLQAPRRPRQDHLGGPLMNDLGSSREMERLGRLKARFPRHRISRNLTPARAWEISAVSPDGSKITALTVASLERKLQGPPARP